MPVRFAKDAPEEHPLFPAIREGNVAEVHNILAGKKSVSLNLQAKHDDLYENPIECACASACNLEEKSPGKAVEILRALLAFGFSVQKGTPFCCLLEPVNEEYYRTFANTALEICQILVEAGADPNETVPGVYDEDLCSPISLAAGVGGLNKVVRLLLKAGADPHVDLAGWSAIAEGVANCNIITTKVLLEYGATFSIKQAEKALSVGCKYPHLFIPFFPIFVAIIRKALQESDNKLKLEPIPEDLQTRINKGLYIIVPSNLGVLASLVHADILSDSVVLAKDDAFSSVLPQFSSSKTENSLLEKAESSGIPHLPRTEKPLMICKAHLLESGYSEEDAEYCATRARRCGLCAKVTVKGVSYVPTVQKHPGYRFTPICRACLH